MIEIHMDKGYVIVASTTHLWSNFEIKCSSDGQLMRVILFVSSKSIFELSQPLVIQNYLYMLVLEILKKMFFFLEYELFTNVT